MTATDPPFVPPARASSDAEAARYVLLRRLAPSMRHHLVVNLQPIGMIYEVMERRLRMASPDLAHAHESARKINGFAKAALASCLDVMSWLAPDPDATIPLSEGVLECAGMLATSFSFRGYTLRNEVPAAATLVTRSSLRNVLTGVLMYATDHLQAPADIGVTAQTDGPAVRIVLALQPTEGELTFEGELAYRKLDWDDVLALADAEGAGVERHEHRLSLVLPLREPLPS